MFEFLTEPTYPRAALGIEGEQITAVELKPEGRRRFGVKQAATIELPKGVLTPNFTDKNIKDRKQFKVILEEALTVAGLLNQKRWSVSLPSNAARTAILAVETAALKKGNKQEIIDWKAEQIFGAPASEMRISRQKIAEDDGGKTRFFATAVKLSVIDEYETVFEDMRLKAGLILPRAVSEIRWLEMLDANGDSLLISEQDDGFTAVVMRGGEPGVVRTVSCKAKEREDEIYRLLLFYNDRMGGSEDKPLSKMLMVGSDVAEDRLKEISQEALGRSLDILGPDDVGLRLPEGGFAFRELAAPSGLAALGWR